MLDSSNSNLGSIDRIEVTSLSVDLNVAAIGTTSGHIFLWNMDAGGLIGALRPLQSVTDSGSGGDDPHHPQRGVDALALRMNEDGLGYRLTAAIGKELILIVS